MSLRARLVLALVVLFAVGMTVYGVASYQAFARAEVARLDDQVRGTLPTIARELGVGGPGRLGGHHGRGGPDGPPRVVVAPSTYAELRGPDGALLDTVQVADDRPAPDLGEVVPSDGNQPVTVAADDSASSWRVLGSVLPDGRTVLVAVPTTAVDEALDRLLTIQLTAGAALLLVLGAGAWLVLRSGLRPLERIAASTRTITAGSLDQRVPVPGADTEVRQVATSLNAMLDDLEDSFRERDATEARLRRFLSDASHELRTPLTSIQGYAELFRLAGDRDDIDLDLVARRIEGESDRMRALVEDLLVLARLDEAQTTARDPVDLTVLAADACSDAAAVEPDRPITLDAPAPAVVAGDPRLLRQAVGNLVSNALRHTPAGTPVEVSVRRTGDTVTVEVRDHGPGLPDGSLTHVFDRFWQADPARSGQGRGLGLSIVQAVAAEHGGTATAANATDGGARFTVTLPTGTSTDVGSVGDDQRATRVP